MDKKENNRRKRTKTSSFGSSGRESHNSTLFYSSKLYEEIPKETKIEYKEKSIAKKNINKIFCKSSEKMDELPSDSVHIVVNQRITLFSSFFFYKNVDLSSYVSLLCNYCISFDYSQFLEQFRRSLYIEF